LIILSIASGRNSSGQDTVPNCCAGATTRYLLLLSVLIPLVLAGFAFDDLLLDDFDFDECVDFDDFDGALVESVAASLVLASALAAGAAAGAVAGAGV
jgi:hypothetical protein